MNKSTKRVAQIDLKSRKQKYSSLDEVNIGDRVRGDRENDYRLGTVTSFGAIMGIPAMSILFDGDEVGTFMQSGYVVVNFTRIF